MTEPRYDALETPDDHARGWVVRLAAGDMDAADFEALAAWREAAEINDKAFVAARRVWQHAGGYEHAFQVQDDLVATRRQRARKARLALGGLAASLVLLITLPAAFGRPLWGADFSADEGRPRRITLADGSVALLDAGSAMDFSQADGVRRVDLWRGAAFFEVAHDTVHPFKVHAGSGIATAVGTAFAVRRAGDDATVSVTQGRVHVENNGQARIIGAGVEAGWHGNGILMPHAFDQGARLAWREGRLVIDDMPLIAALNEVSRYEHGYVILLDSEAGTRRVSGVFLTARADAAIAILAHTQGLKVSHITPYLTVVS